MPESRSKMTSMAKAMDTRSDVELVNDAFVNMKAAERVSWLHEQFGSRLVLSSSFGLQAAVMLHLVSQHAPKMPVVWLDTGYLFPETYQYAEQLIEQLGVDVQVYQSKISAARQEALYGKLWQQGEEGNAQYSLINKVEPMNRALLDLGADIWVSGLRRSHSSTRVNRAFGEQQKKTLKVYPILDWADAQVSAYFYDNNLPKHPLESQGYQTMGDWHSTSAVEEGDTAESSRFGGEKYECGLHLDSSSSDFQI
jgi:phosphoadenosine phosphosulfate reductase